MCRPPTLLTSTQNKYNGISAQNHPFLLFVPCLPHLGHQKHEQNSRQRICRVRRNLQEKHTTHFKEMLEIIHIRVRNLWNGWERVESWNLGVFLIFIKIICKYTWQLLKPLVVGVLQWKLRRGKESRQPTKWLPPSLDHWSIR